MSKEAVEEVQERGRMAWSGVRWQTRLAVTDLEYGLEIILTDVTDELTMVVRLSEREIRDNVRFWM